MKKIIFWILMTFVLVGCNEVEAELNNDIVIDETEMIEVVLDTPKVEVEIEPIVLESIFKETSYFQDQRVDNLTNFYDQQKKLFKPEVYNYDSDKIEVIMNPYTFYVMGNKLNQLPSDFVPEHLVIPNVTFSFSGEDEKKHLVEDVAIALEKLFDAATSEDLTLVAVSGYRSYQRQEAVYNHWVSVYGQEEADKFSARPGHSEHQTGLTMDISCATLNYSLEYSFGDLKEGIWVAEHAHEFGFIIRYPNDKTEITGYNYEPWHLRYLGVELAVYLYENNLTIEEYYYSLLN